MKAALVRRFGGPEVLEVADVPIPRTGPGQVRIRVAAAAVNRIDLSTRDGALARAGLLAPAPETRLGWDVAGTVDEGGRFAPGTPVVGLRDVLSAGGTQAEFVVLDEGAVAPAPASVPMAEAATLPLIGLTAAQSLDRTGLHAGQTLLVTGAAGGVGGLVRQLAELRGIRTVAIESRTERLADVVREQVPGGVDAVIDAAVLGMAAHDALRGGGTFVALVRPFAPAPLRGTRVVVQEVRADGGRLAELSALVDAGRLTLRVAGTLQLERIADAHERLAAGGLRGRLVLRIVNA
jgi:NADPH:quinone reductase-like Zn-dependent oxidoreductase